ILARRSARGPSPEANRPRPSTADGAARSTLRAVDHSLRAAAATKLPWVRMVPPPPDQENSMTTTDDETVRPTAELNDRELEHVHGACGDDGSVVCLNNGNLKYVIKAVVLEYAHNYH